MTPDREVSGAPRYLCIRIEGIGTFRMYIIWQDKS